MSLPDQDSCSEFPGQRLNITPEDQEKLAEILSGGCHGCHAALKRIVELEEGRARMMKENVSLRLAVGDDTISLLSKLEAERQKNADLRDALEYYANDEMYEPDWSDGKETILKDRGREARKALGRSS